MRYNKLALAATAGFMSVATFSNSEGGATEVKTKKTTAELLADAEARVEKLKAQLAAETAANDVQTGDKVKFKFGRGEKQRELEGTVGGTRRDENDSLWIAVTTPAGEDVFSDPAQTYKLRVSDLIQNFTAEERRAAEAGEAVDPLSTNEG